MLHLKRINGYLALDPRECRELGRSLAQAYQAARPFPNSRQARRRNISIGTRNGSNINSSLPK
jgi:hypothetical protein